MQEFQAGFLDSGTGDPDIGKNLRRWMLEYAVLHGMPPSRAREYTNPAMMQRDAFRQLSKSRKPIRMKSCFRPSAPLRAESWSNLP